MKRPVVNISIFERFARVLLGGVAAVIGVILLIGAASSFVAFLEVLLILAGLDMVVTGALGHCPLYAKLGHVPSSLRGAS